MIAIRHRGRHLHPSVLVPLNLTNFFEEIPKNLIQNITPEQSLKSNFVLLMMLHDIILQLENNDKDMIKSQRFPLETRFKKFFSGKNISKNDLDSEENYAFCKNMDNEVEIKSIIFLTGDTFYLTEIVGNNFDEFSEVKVNKKIYLRYLDIKVSRKSEEIIEIGDNSFEKSNRKYFLIHCLNADNTGRMFNFLHKQKINCLEMEYSMVNSFLDELESKFKSNNINKI